MKLAALTSGLCILALATAATAQTDKAPTRVLNLDELRACLTNAPKLTEREKELSARVPPLQAKLAALKSESDQIAEEQKAAADYNPPRKLRFEARKKDFNQRVTAAGEETQAFEKDRAQLNKDVEAHNKNCTGVSFRSEDKATIDKEMGTAK